MRWPFGWINSSFALPRKCSLEAEHYFVNKAVQLRARALTIRRRRHRYYCGPVKTLHNIALMPSSFACGLPVVSRNDYIIPHAQTSVLRCPFSSLFMDSGFEPEPAPALPHRQRFAHRMPTTALLMLRSVKRRFLQSQFLETRLHQHRNGHEKPDLLKRGCMIEKALGRWSSSSPDEAIASLVTVAALRSSVRRAPARCRSIAYSSTAYWYK